jgi:DNA-binding response OmpR family regulator
VAFWRKSSRDGGSGIEKPSSQRGMIQADLLLSARAGEEPKVEGQETGADDLIRPFTAEELSHLDMVRMCSEAARREQDLRWQVSFLPPINDRLVQ